MLNLEMEIEFKALQNLTRIFSDWEVRLSPRFITYSPRFNVNIETNRYQLKTATSMDELIKTFRLRNHVFKNDPLKLDYDHLDHQCDHLLIIDKTDDCVVGTYRLIFGPTFYSDAEFKLGSFKQLEGEKLELGRACIIEDHRNGSVIDLLWKGIGKYQELTQAQYLFGCSSIFTVNPKEMSALMAQMKNKGRHLDHLSIRPTNDFIHAGLEQSCNEPITATLPPLLASYFMAGAKVHGVPAFDKDFDCFDWLTILDINELSSSYKRRYFSHLESKEYSCAV